MELYRDGTTILNSCVEVRLCEKSKWQLLSQRNSRNDFSDVSARLLNRPGVNNAFEWRRAQNNTERRLKIREYDQRHEPGKFSYVLLLITTAFFTIYFRFPQFRSLESEKEMLLVQINSLADANLANEPVLLEGKQKIKDVSEKGEALAKAVEEKMQELSK